MQKLLNPFPKEIPLVPFLQEERMQIRNYRFSFFAGGTDANKEKTYFLQEERMQKIIKSISEGNTACSFLQEERMQKLLNPFPKEIPLVPYFINLIKKK